jgi:carboxyl-terminal processing protease
MMLFTVERTDLPAAITRLFEACAYLKEKRMFHSHLLVRMALLILALTSAACALPLPLPQISQPAQSPTPTDVAAATPMPDPLMAILSEAQRRTLLSTVMARMRTGTPVEITATVDWEFLRTVYEPRVIQAASTAEVYAILKEMVAELGDPRARLYDPAEIAVLTGPFGGIGANLQLIGDGLIFASLTPDGPAAEAGLQPRDRVVAVDGTPVPELAEGGLETIIMRIRGEPGSQLVLTVQTVGEVQHNVTLTRRLVGRPAPSRTLILPDTNVGLLVLTDFSALAEIRASLDTLFAGTTLNGLIIDLRLPTSGRINEIVAVLDLFTGAGLIGQIGDFRVRVPGSGDIDEIGEIPIVVLIGPETNGPSEIFAAGMHVLDRGILLGESTAGRAEIASGEMLASGAYLSLPGSDFSYPDGAGIVGIGVLPDVVVAAEWWRYPLVEDPQIKAAVDLMQQP